MAAKNFGAVPEPGDLTDADRALMERSRNAFRAVGAELERSRFKNAITEALDVVRDANRYLSDQAPWKLKDDPARVRSILHTALQVVDDAKSLLTPFLPYSSQQVYEMLGGQGVWSGMPELKTVSEEGGPDYRVLTGDYATEARWESTPIKPGVPLTKPTPLFKKLDPSVVDEELARLESP
jgi:methionyl-tRNA synthetase